MWDEQFINGASDLWLPSEKTVETFPLPPARSRAQVLPFQTLTGENFERLCWRLAFRSGDVVDCRRYGVSGVPITQSRSLEAISGMLRSMCDSLASTVLRFRGIS
jgi:hypothetical protein